MKQNKITTKQISIKLDHQQPRNEGSCFIHTSETHRYKVGIIEGQDQLLWTLLNKHGS